MSRFKHYHLAIGCLLIVLATIFGINVKQSNSSAPHARMPIIPARNEAVTGLLGNTPVRIPAEYAHLVEYDKEPPFTDRPSRKSSAGDYQTRIRVFGFEALFPNMAGRRTAILNQTNSKNIYTSLWLDVTILSNEYYGGLDHMEREVETLVLGEFNHFKFSKASEKFEDLEVFLPKETDMKRARAAGTIDMQNYNIYTHRNNDGYLDTYITCVNVAHAAVPCTMRFLIPEPMKARVTVSFRIGLLQSWKDIRSSTLKLIQSFALNDDK